MALSSAVQATSAALDPALGLPTGRLIGRDGQGLPLVLSPTQAGFPSPDDEHRVVRLDLNAGWLRKRPLPC